MNRTSLLPLLIALALGAAVIADQNVAVGNGNGQDILLYGVRWNWRAFDKNGAYASEAVNNDVPNNRAENTNDEPLFLRSRKEAHHDCRPCNKGEALFDRRADLNTETARVIDTFNVEFINLLDH